MKKILIIEDERALAGAVKEKLENSGYEVLIAKNGEEGLRMIYGDKPDLVLLDIVMPVMDGMTMLEKLRKEEWGKDMKVILLTNLEGPEERSTANEYGANDYLVKSDWKLEDILEKVKEVLGE
jgi:DNA-binding response OmpR family regulator